MQEDTRLFSTPHSLEREIKLPQVNITAVMLIWCLKQVIEFILEFSISGSFFSEKEFLISYTMILSSLLSGGCVDRIVDNRTNYQWYEYVYWITI